MYTPASLDIVWIQAFNAITETARATQDQAQELVPV
jgi:hypothetical protein